jgi:hypothetical protein
MTTKAVVAALRTRPETVLDDYARLFELAGGAKALSPSATTILKDMYWPLKYKRLAKHWRTNTEWGRLFERYRQEGCLVA